MRFGVPLGTVTNKYRLLPILALLLWMGLILFLSSRSSLPGDRAAIGWLGQYKDEVGHLGEYGVLGMLTYAVLRPRLDQRKCFVWGLAYCVAFSLADEAFQGLVPNRTPEIKDLLLDGVAATVALVGLSVLGPRIWRYWLGRVPGGAGP